MLGALAALSCGAETGDAVQDAQSESTSSSHNVPECLRRIDAECGLTGACTVATSPMYEALCFASGAHRYTRERTACPSDQSMTWSIEVRKPDGSLCYTAETNCDCSKACEYGKGTYYRLDGSAFYKYEFTYTGYTHECVGEAPVKCEGFECQGPGQSTHDACTVGPCD